MPREPSEVIGLVQEVANKIAGRNRRPAVRYEGICWDEHLDAHMGGRLAAIVSQDKCDAIDANKGVAEFPIILSQ